MYDTFICCCHGATIEMIQNIKKICKLYGTVSQMYQDTAELYFVTTIFTASLAVSALRRPHICFCRAARQKQFRLMSQQLGERPLVGGQGKIGLPGCTRC